MRGRMRECMRECTKECMGDCTRECTRERMSGCVSMCKCIIRIAAGRELAHGACGALAAARVENTYP
jgi:hypothetical protein